jgi:hypothetical protein
MRSNLLRAGLLLAVVGLTGCGGQVGVTPDGTPARDAGRLGDKTDVSLAGWLKLSRPELAKLAAEWSDRVQKQQRHAAENPASVDLLPGLQPPASLPGFRDAAYSAAAGVSLPPYLPPNDKDAAVALHLARLGDREAARKLGGDDVLQQAHAPRYDKDYPVEWTRLVGLAFQSAELELASGEVQGATDLVQMHRQLRDVLDAKAAAGPLGAALLPLGRRALLEAAAAWRAVKNKKPELAGDIDAALKQGGRRRRRPPCWRRAPPARRRFASSRPPPRAGPPSWTSPPPCNAPSTCWNCPRPPTAPRRSWRSSTATTACRSCSCSTGAAPSRLTPSRPTWRITL